MFGYIFLLVVILILIAIIILLIKAVNIQLNKNSIYQQWIIDLQNDVENVYKTIKNLDDKQMFFKDDEVGSVFYQMLDLIKSLNDKISKE